METNKNRIPKMHLLCANDDSRKSLNYVSLSKEYTCATDAEALLSFNTSDVFDEDFIAGITEDLLITQANWKRMTAADVTFIWWNNGQIMYKTKKHEEGAIIPLKESDIGTYPSFLNVIPEPTGAQLNAVGVNAKMLLKIQNATMAEGCICEFTGENRTIIVTPLRPEIDIAYKAIVMPMVIDL